VDGFLTTDLAVLVFQLGHHKHVSDQGCW
jgi:hypothetical protein